MPILKVDHVVSFSSEDPNYTANNLLLTDPAKKWKCKSPGEKSTIAVLQMEKASVISAIDVGNENSAYVEILVTRSGMPDEYKVLLVMSALMSPIESRQGTNTNRVRMFTKEELSKPECDQKWDRIKIVCTQPFNRHVQYGLSFVTFHSSEDEPPTQSNSAVAVGKFSLRAESPDIFTAGRLFLRKKEEDQNPPTTAAAIRKADHSLERVQKIVDVGEKLKKKVTVNSYETKYSLPKKRDDISLLYDEEEQKLTPIKQDTVGDVSQVDQSKTQKRKKDYSSERHTKEQDAKKVKTVNASESHETPSTSKGRRNGKHHHPLNKPNLRRTKPFDKLLEGVVIVISGIQNPDRADLRSKALTMGAKYSGDWNDRCTHLICAFPNTPKFNQVRGKGKIVTKKWIEDCYSQRKRLPWRRYCLDKNDKDKDESEEEVHEEQGKVEQTDLATSGSDTDTCNNLDAGSDTEERIQKILIDKRREANKDDKQDICGTDSVFSADTEPENNDSINIDEIDPGFKDLFVDKVFFIDSCIDKGLYRLLNKYITAYNGRIVDDPTEPIDIYLTNESNYAEMHDIDSSAKCIQPEWIFQCHNKQELLPYDDYLS